MSILAQTAADDAGGTWKYGFYSGSFGRSLRDIELRFAGETQQAVASVCAFLLHTYTLDQAANIFDRDERTISQIRELGFPIGEKHKFAILDILMYVYGE